MKKWLSLILCAVLLMTMSALALAEDGRIHITYSFWGNQTEDESVQAALDTFNSMQDKIFVEPMQIPNAEYTQTLVNYTQKFCWLQRYNRINRNPPASNRWHSIKFIAEMWFVRICTCVLA